MDYILVLTSLFFSAFFSGLEIAFVSADKLKIEIERQKGGLVSRIISNFTQKPDKYIATMLLGNNASLVIYGLVMAKLLEPVIAKFVHSEFGVLLIQTILSTLLILIAAEFMPKIIFKKYPNRTLRVFAIPVWIAYVILYPLTQFTIWISNFFLQFFKKGKREDTEKIVFGKVDLNSYLSKFTETSEEIEDELKIIQNALDFEDIKIRQCIVPRNEIVAIEENASISDLKKIIIETGYSKIPVYRKSIDNIIGYVHVHGLYRNPKNIKQIMVDIPIIPETMTAKKLFNILIKRKRSLALVVDEYGGTSGIVTIEDILEEIFGEIEDEHDVEELILKREEDGTYLVSGRAEIDRINEEFNLNIPETEEYETIAGLILEKLERFPEKGEVIDFEDFKLEIIDAEQPKIELVKIIPEKRN